MTPGQMPRDECSRAPPQAMSESLHLEKQDGRVSPGPPLSRAISTPVGPGPRHRDSAGPFQGVSAQRPCSLKDCCHTHPARGPGGGGLRAFCKHLSYRSSDRRGVPSLSVPRGVGRGRSREMCQAGLWGSGRTCKVSAWPPGSTHTWGHGRVRRGQRAGLLPWCPQGSITAWRLQQGAQDAGRASPEGGACSP